MLKIVCGRTWELVQTFLDNFDGPESDMSHIVTTKCEIRTKTNVAVATVTSVLDGAQITLSLTREETEALPVGEYLIDILGTNADDNDESLMDPEPISVVNHPTFP